MIRTRFTRGATTWAVLATFALLSAFALGSSDAAAQAQDYSATLSGDSEVPDAVTTSATGSFSATLDGDSLTFSLTATGEGITQAHIHVGPTGENGPVVAFLFGLDEAGVAEVDASGTITEADLLGPLEGDFAGFVEALEAGNLYVNVHSVANPPGEIRGQIAVTPSAPTVGTGLAASTENGGATQSAILWGASAAGLVALAALTFVGLRRGRRVGV